MGGKLERGVGFEDVLITIDNSDLLDILPHPKSERYPGQQIFVVKIHNYFYYVPFVENGSHIFLKTIIPSRKIMKNDFNN